MPPPKKLKTGLSRVEAFLTKTEVDELRREYLNRTSHLSRGHWCSDSSSEFIAHEQTLLSSRMDLATSYSDEAQDLSMHKPVESRAESVRSDSDGRNRSYSPHMTKLIDMIASERSDYMSKEGRPKCLETMLSSDYGPTQLGANPAAVFPKQSIIESNMPLIHRKAVSKPMPSLQYVPLRYTDYPLGEPHMPQSDVPMQLIRKVIGTSCTVDARVPGCSATSPHQWSEPTVSSASTAPTMISSKCLSEARLYAPHMSFNGASEPIKDLLVEKRNLCKFLESGTNSSGFGAESSLQKMLTSSLHAGNPLDKLQTMLPSCGPWKSDNADGRGNMSSPSPAAIPAVFGNVTVTDTVISPSGIYQQKQATSLLQKHVELDASAWNTIGLRYVKQFL